MNLLTVTHTSEIFWLQLQAKSINKFVPENEIDQIFVIINEVASSDYASLFRSIVLPFYGKHKSKVTLVPRGELLEIPDWVHGWRSQQALKLASVNLLCQTNSSILLDTKNHFIRTASRDRFFETDGRIKTWRMDHDGHMRKFFEASLENFELSSETYIKNWTPTVTPFCVLREDVKECLAELDRKWGDRYLERIFIRSDCFSTEFFLVSAFLQKKYGDLDRRYVFREPFSVILFADKLEDDNRFGSIMHQASLDRCLSFALHHLTVKKLKAHHKYQIAGLWLSCNLINELEEARPYFELYGAQSDQ